ncbi:MAG: flap endonuclease [Actinobacteria bacterium]|nr:flap endonuclease [Actinomycetota bacterium]
MQVHLVDGTYELYRQHFGQAVRHSKPAPFSATIGVLNSTIQLLADGATHVGIAMDHTIESFRNDLYDGYKTSEGMEPEILEQIPLVADALEALGFIVWRMERFEADDALASAATVACEDRTVHKVFILSPDKDLAQCVEGKRVVQMDRRNGTITDEQGVVEKFGIGPASIPDYLGLVGDTSDGFPGLSGWGPKSASTVLARYRTIEAIPDSHVQWQADGVTVRGAEKLAMTLAGNRTDAQLFKTLATLVRDVEVGDVASWKWSGARGDVESVLERCGATSVLDRLRRLK